MLIFIVYTTQQVKNNAGTLHNLYKKTFYVHQTFKHTQLGNNTIFI